ncbi:hypothetical protein RB2150_08628 [Rhodobacterales bacterium HTCC2150]|nr:hypothetical protein RB2150_08628 [Rhodobacterales bacterium HTCC2150] [Rhodobacteraceae bacterium HTCC2150]
MNQFGNVIDRASVGIHLNEISSATKAHIRTLARNVSGATSRIMLALQVGRMTSALMSLSDEQLEQIGVMREDIDEHARALITYEYGGL